MAGRYGLEIRAADEGDAPGLGELLRACGRPVDGRRLAERLEAMTAEPGVVLLAAEWGPPSGVIGLNWRWRLDGEQREAEVATLLVDPEARRRGVARLLLKAGSQAARSAGCGELRIAIPEADEGLGAFCLASGFAAEGRSLVRALRKRS